MIDCFTAALVAISAQKMGELCPHHLREIFSYSFPDLHSYHIKKPVRIFFDLIENLYYFWYAYIYFHCASPFFWVSGDDQPILKEKRFIFNCSQIYTIYFTLPGIPGFDNVKEYESNKYRYRNPHEIISYLENKKLLFKPGAHYAYSNTGYLMLGIIIERITGKSYKEAIEYYITNKINLHETDVITSESLKKLIVRGHHNGNVLTETDNYVFPFAAGSIISTPKDLIIFFQTLMSGKLLTKDSLQKMVSDMNLMTVKQTTYYGKGIVAALGTPIGNIIGHTGGIRGFGSSLFYHPEKNIFACVMMNDDIKAADPAMFRLMETMMKM